MDKQLDVKRMLNIERGQIYLCKLDDNPTHNNEPKIYSKTGLIGKTRPCMILSSDKYNSQDKLTYRIIPIKTDDIGLSRQEFMEDSNDILIPIDMAEGTKFLVINQSRPINIGCISTYIGTITNKDLLDKIDAAIIEMDTNYCINEEDIQIAKMVKDRFGSMYKFQRFLNDNRVKKAVASFGAQPYRINK